MLAAGYSAQMEHNLQHFYIPEEQSIYLLSHQDAAKIRAWIKLCIRQLEKLGYREIELIGKGAFGFVFAGQTPGGVSLVFKFSRINLPQHVQDRLEDESYLQSQLDHPRIPKVIDYVRVGKQGILVMTRAPGVDLERFSLQQGAMPAKLIIKIAYQLHELLTYLHQFHDKSSRHRPIVHGDIKPSNLVFDPHEQSIQLVDWGSSVFAQVDRNGQFLSTNVMDLMSSDLQSSNAKLGDVYFIGEEQISGQLSSVRFDEQGAAATLYALASSQGARFGRNVITPLSLGLPIEFARVLNGLLNGDADTRRQAGDYFYQYMPQMHRIVLPEQQPAKVLPKLPVWIGETDRQIDTVVYSSRKSFMRQQQIVEELDDIADEQLEKYYKNFLQGMGETEKGFLAAVSRLGRFPMVGGLTVKWAETGVKMVSAFSLFDASMKQSFVECINNVVSLARALKQQGTFKAVMYDARDTLHIDRVSEHDAFHVPKWMTLPYSTTAAAESRRHEPMHSYFEDGRDPDEHLELPESIMEEIRALDKIHHAGCIIFEALPKNLKIHNYFRLLEPNREEEFATRLQNILNAVPDIEGLGIGGYMKMPYQDERFFEHQLSIENRFFPHVKR